MQQQSFVEITPRRSWIDLDLREIWRHRDLLGILVWRDVKVRYKQTALGAMWVILQPILTMLIFSMLFGRVAKLPSDGIPYPIFVFTALLPWQLFAHALSDSGNSLIANQQLITKVYFPRLVIPLAAVLSGVVDFAVAFTILILLMLFYGIVPTLAVLTLPLFVLLAVATATAVGLWLAVFNVQYRDVRYTIPFLTQFWLFMTPIAYSSSLIPERWRLLYGLNPMAGVAEGFRWALLGRGDVGPLIGIAVGMVTVLLIGGLVYFRHMEDSFADMV
jgi:lipopolysaccharide transport system permease protein